MTMCDERRLFKQALRYESVRKIRYLEGFDIHRGMRDLDFSSPAMVIGGSRND
jgi:hypothetical protein